MIEYGILKKKEKEDSPSCTWTEPWDNTEKWTGTPTSNTAWTYKADTSDLKACEWWCKDGYVRDGENAKCKKEGGWWWNGYTCEWILPDGVITWSVAPTNNTTKWKCATDTKKACTYTCTDGYVCKNLGKNDWCEKSDNITFLPNMHIDEIKGCKMKYHFNEYDPISGKSCCSPVRLMKSYDESSWQPLTTSYDKNGTTVTSNWKEWMIYFKYSVDWWQTYSSVSSYKMSKQNCSTSCSL